MPITLPLRDELIALEVLPPVPLGEENIESYQMLITNRINGRHRDIIAEQCPDKDYTVITIDQSAMNAITHLFNEDPIDLLVISSNAAMANKYIFAITVDDREITPTIRQCYKDSFTEFLEQWNR